MSRLAPVAALAAAAAIAGCGSSSSTSAANSAGASSSSSSSAASTGSTGAGASPTAAADPAVAKLVPAAIKSKGTLTVAADATYAPDEFVGTDGKTIMGMDPDLMTVLAGKMGLKVNVVNATFDSIIPGLSSGRFDLGASSFTDNKTREKTVDFVTYYSAGESFYTKASGGTDITSIASICGKTISVEKGTTEQTDAQAQGDKCKKNHKAGVNVLVFPDQNGANLAVSSGRAALGFADSPVAAYQVKKSNGTFKLVGASYSNAPYGFALPKKSGLAPALLAAVKSAMQDGSYAKVLAKWGLGAGAITDPKINGATS